MTQVVSEMDVTTGTPVDEAKLIDQGYYYRDAFRIFRAHAADLFAVTLWGLHDGRSWRSAGAPLLFDASLKAKPAYFGAVDGELDARLRTAFVFQGSVPLDAAATGALAWQQLPLHRFGDDKVGFQLRWEADHLTAYVEVADATPEPADAATFVVDDATFVFRRDGTGDVSGVVDEEAGGWKAVVHLPLTGAAIGDQLSFDVSVTDGADTVGWNDAGATGTLTLVESVSFTDVGEAATAPVIDGETDAVWATANTVATDKQIEGSGGASAAVRTLWQDNTLYVLAHVTDPILDDTGSDPWIEDSVEIYVDAGNVKNGSYRFDDTQIRINFNNVTSFGTGDEAFQANRLTSATKVVADGYVVEASISLLEAGGVGTFHGLDFQVNDATAGVRTSIRNWADPTGLGYQSTSRWGVGRLVAAAGADVDRLCRQHQGQDRQGRLVRRGPVSRGGVVRRRPGALVLLRPRPGHGCDRSDRARRGDDQRRRPGKADRCHDGLDGGLLRADRQLRRQRPRLCRLVDVDGDHGRRKGRAEPIGGELERSALKRSRDRNPTHAAPLP